MISVDDNSVETLQFQKPSNIIVKVVFIPHGQQRKNTQIQNTFRKYKNTKYCR